MNPRVPADNHRKCRRTRVPKRRAPPKESSMGKRLRFDAAARRALWRGIDQLASAVRIPLGPRGRSVVLDRTHGSMPSITRDGIAIAQELELPDPLENMGVQMLREVALRPGQAAGDWTS